MGSSLDKLTGPFDALKDIYPDGVGVLIGNGPSLRDVPDKFLRKYPSFGTNLIGIRFHPTYYFLFGGDHINTPERQEAVREHIAARRTKGVFVNLMWQNLFKSPKTWALLDWYFMTIGWPPDERIIRWTWSANPFIVCGSGFTTSYMMMQFAHFMGIRTLLCVGFDGHYDVADPLGQHFYEQGVDDVKYDPPPYPWETPEQWAAQCDYVFTIARQAFEQTGGRILNLTPESAYKALEEGNLEEWL